MQGKKWPKSESVKQCRFCYAKIQRDPNAAQSGVQNTAQSSVQNAAQGTVPNDEDKGGKLA